MKWIISSFLLVCVTLCADQPPHPAEIAPGWWTYFVVEDPAVRAERLQAAVEKFESIRGQLEIDHQQEADQLIGRFRKSVELLDQAIELELPQTVNIDVVKTTYALDEFLELAKQARAASREHDAAIDKLEEVDGRLSLAKQSLDSSFAVFIGNVAAPSSARVLEGLTIMVKRAELEMGRKMRDALLKKAKHLGGVAEKYRLHIEDVKSRVVAQQTQLKKVEIRIEELRKKQQTAGRLNSLALNGSTDIQQAEAEQTLIQTQLVSLQMRQALANEAIDEEEVARWKAHINRTEFFSQQWRDDSTRSLVRYSKQPGDVPIEERDRLIALLNLAGELDEEIFVAKRLLDIVNEHIIRSSPLGSLLFTGAIAVAHDVYEWVGEWIFYPLFTVGEEEAPITPWSLLKVGLIFLGAILLSRLIRSRLEAVATRRGGTSTSNFYVFGRLIHFLFLTMAFLASLSILGLRLSTLLIVGGALGVGIGFGLQGIVNNFVCGLILLFEKNVRVGDFIKLSEGTVGKVCEINVQSIVVRTFDGMDIIIPNSSLLSSSVTNWTLRDPYLRLHIPFSVAYGTDPDLVHKVVKEAALNQTFTLKDDTHQPQVWLVNLADSGHEYELVTWINVFKTPRTSSVRAMYLAAVERALTGAKIQIPFPQRDLYIKDLPLTKNES